MALPFFTHALAAFQLLSLTNTALAAGDYFKVASDFEVSDATTVTMAAGDKIAARPAIEPGFDLEAMARNLTKTLPTQEFKTAVWGQGWLPESCKSEADTHKIPYSEFKVFEVTYEDCRAPWVFCVQEGTSQSMFEIFSAFGQMPVGLRSMMS
jgi:hypothetical protein